MIFGKRIDKPGGVRKAVREAALASATIMTMTDTRSADLLDLSKSGARLRARELPSEGQEVMLLLGRLEAFGTIAWQLGDECGVQFDIALTDGAFATILRECVSPHLPGARPDAMLAANDWQNGLSR